VLALKTPDDLDAARDLVRRHGGRGTQSAAESTSTSRLDPTGSVQ
jgi:hypothetical protein